MLISHVLSLIRFFSQYFSFFIYFLIMNNILMKIYVELKSRLKIDMDAAIFSQLDKEVHTCR